MGNSLIQQSGEIVDVGGALKISGTNGFTIGNTAGQPRFQYGGVANSFTMLTAANAFANLYIKDLVSDGNIFLGASGTSRKVNIGTTISDFLPSIVVKNTNTINGAVSSIGFYCNNSNEGFQIGLHPSTFPEAPNLAYLYQEKNAPISFIHLGGEAMRINPNRNVLINTTTDNGARLQVNGDGFFNRNLNLADGTLFISAGGGNNYSTRLSTEYSFPNVTTYLDSYAGSSYNGNIVFRTNTNNGSLVDRMVIDSTGNASFGGNVLIGTTTNNGAKLQVNGTGTFIHGIKTTSVGPYAEYADTLLGDSAFVQYGVNAAANSTGSYFNIFNPAGRGFSYTRGGVIDFEITPAGVPIFRNMPTSAAGLPSGALWNNGGVVNIV